MLSSTSSSISAPDGSPLRPCSDISTPANMMPQPGNSSPGITPALTKLPDSNPVAKPNFNSGAHRHPQPEPQFGRNPFLERTVCLTPLLGRLCRDQNPVNH